MVVSDFMAIFKDRVDAGEKLADLINQSNFLKKIKNKTSIIVVSLLRGGVVVGQQIAKKIGAKNFPLPVAKISSPQNPELAIGAFCFSLIYWEKEVLDSYFFDKNDIDNQLKKAKDKFFSYCQKFNIDERSFDSLKNKVIILVDDGIATGATVLNAFYFLRTKKPKKIILASPVAPHDFKNPGFDQVFICHQEKYFSAISQFYEDFSSVEILKI
jgi:predicted phosphoribosyltransferase